MNQLKVKSTEEIQYEKLLEFFKFVLKIASGFFVGVAAVVTYLTYDNFSDLRKDLKEQENEIKKEAKAVALKSANEKVEEVFQTPNLQRVVDSIAKKELANKVKALIENEQTALRRQYQILPTLSIALDRIRNGSRRAWFTVDSIYKNSEDDFIKETCFYIMREKRIDYQEYVKLAFSDSDHLSAPKDSIWISDKLYSIRDTIKVIKSAYSIISYNKDLNQIAYGFKCFQLVYGKGKIEMFDFEKANVLYKQIVNKKK